MGGEVYATGAVKLIFGSGPMSVYKRSQRKSVFDAAIVESNAEKFGKGTGLFAFTPYNRRDYTYRRRKNISKVCGNGFSRAGGFLAADCFAAASSR